MQICGGANVPMMDRPNTYFFKLRLVFGGMCIVASLLALSVFLSTIVTSVAQAMEAHEESQPPTSQYVAFDDPNAVTAGLSAGAQGFGQAVKVVGDGVADGLQKTAAATARSSKSFAVSTKKVAGTVARTAGRATSSAARTVGRGMATAGRGIADGVVFVLRLPGKAITAVSNTSVVRGVIRPSDQVEVPIIDPNSPELYAALEALPPAPEKNNKKSSQTTPLWPIHGEITTHFGVDHWPFQHTHSGIDISDGKPSGTTPIKPFRPGKVIETIHSAYGLGNHVIVDHGSGVTSVYAHLYSISVKVGQPVGQNSILGYEGSTGASTGTHLHFEVRVNGRAADPRRFIVGLP